MDLEIQFGKNTKAEKIVFQQRYQIRAEVFSNKKAISQLQRTLKKYIPFQNALSKSIFSFKMHSTQTVVKPDDPI